METYSKKEESQSVLRQCGLRVTPQRLAIFDFLRDSKDHPNAEGVYQAVKDRCPAMSLNTVYKNLEAFEQAGLITKFTIGDRQKFHYDPNTKTHPHLLCLSCSMVKDIDAEIQPHVCDLNEALAAQTGHQIHRIEIHLVGVCRECLQAAN